MVLATDMSSHFQQIKAMKNILNHSENFSADKSKILSLVIHISDISHPAKDWELHRNWTSLLMEEFFRQGDREKELNLECSPLCDRETTLVPESQLGFIEYIVTPSLEICGDVLDKVHQQLAEANARPVLPASAKTASLVLSGKQPQQQSIANEPSKSPAAPASHDPPKRPSCSSRPPPLPVPLSGSARPATSQPAASKPRPFHATPTSSFSSTLSSSSLAGSLSSPESLASNLRNLIVSSSATLGRKLGNMYPANQSSQVSNNGSNNSNVTRNSSRAGAGNVAVLSAPAPPKASSGGPNLQPSAVASTVESTSCADFATGQANYKHPVIKCDTPTTGTLEMEVKIGTSDQSRPTVCPQNTTGGMRTSRCDDFPGNSNLLSANTSRSAPATQPFRVDRPWVRCLDRNKKMWQDLAAKESATRSAINTQATK